MRFTALIPTHNNGPVVGRAIRSVLRQTERDLELFVVGDGAPEETLAVVRNLADSDPRVRLFAYEKGERHGEALRHQALEEATGEFVCYLADDDFWFPDHLRVMGRMLQSADFANTRFARVYPNWRICGYVGTFDDMDLRRRLLETKTSFFGLSFGAHRMDAYRRLPEGWAPAPQGIWTDLHMLRKWLSAPGMRFATSPLVTGLNFPAETWRDNPKQQQQAEQNIWYELFKDPAMVKAIRRNIPSDDTHLPLHRVIAAANHTRRGTPGFTGAIRRLFSR
ncbi:glycosyltransferase family 2 protein [Parvibaculum sp.]|jgi:glycosyltransferase involved in cell wall biosynthesis|uniref:glycosyltransferase family 2 protein n=1 Tax=Parvibaculum sp. TaxID=2024848 RepID=UPI002FDA5096